MTTPAGDGAAEGNPMVLRSGTTELARRLKALSDPTRLSVVALLARRPHYGEELADFLGLSPATISHHVKQLREAGLVEGTREMRHVLLQLDHAELSRLGELLHRPQALADHLGVPSEEELSRQVLQDWLDDRGRLRELPLAERPRAIVLRWAALQLETDRLYPERELRFVLMGVSREPDQLRDELVRQGWLRRAGTVYRRIEESEPQ